MEHIAIMDKNTINLILNGNKIIESRFSINKISPYNKVKVNDVIYLKETSKQIIGMFRVLNVIYLSDLNEQKIDNIKQKYNHLILANDNYWERKKTSKYGTLIYISKPTKIEPIIYKHIGQSGFITLDKRLYQN